MAQDADGDGLVAGHSKRIDATSISISAMSASGTPGRNVVDIWCPKGPLVWNESA